MSNKNLRNTVLAVVLALAGPSALWADSVVRGQVEHSAGGAASGHPVTIQAVSGNLSGKIFSAFADDNGRFQLYLPPGEYRIAPAYQPEATTQSVHVTDQKQHDLTPFRLQ